MNIDELAELLYQETGGYPFLVCRICKKLDLVGSEGIETLSDAWTRKGFLMAERELLSERNTLFDSLWHQVEEYPRLREKLMDILFTGSDYPYNIYLPEIEIWHGQEYHEKGEKQLSEYLDSYHLKKGYMISFCFNKKKEVGVKEVLIGDKVLVEALV